MKVFLDIHYFAYSKCITLFPRLKHPRLLGRGCIYGDEYDGIRYVHFYPWLPTVDSRIRSSRYVGYDEGYAAAFQ